ncbi:MAG: hypothetical protein IKI04_00220 [Bacilli bacterium]|nr:hypothetical protein [Bacilli bacterium]
MGKDYNQIYTHHYTCWNTTGECDTVAFIHYANSINSYYVNLVDGEGVNDAVDNMFTNDSVNTYNSLIKETVDFWYKVSLDNYTNYLEDAVYCNDRDIISYGGWQENGGSEVSYEFRFKSYNTTTDLSCTNVTDQFALDNTKAKLTYPVALETFEEIYTLTNNNNSSYYGILVKTSTSYWVNSPYEHNKFISRMRYVNPNGSVNVVDNTDTSNGVRPVVTLANCVAIESGDGSTTNPWIVE